MRLRVTDTDKPNATTVNPHCACAPRVKRVLTRDVKGHEEHEKVVETEGQVVRIGE